MKKDKNYYAVCEHLLRHSPQTREQMQVALGLPLTTLHKVVARLHNEGRIHVGGWALDPHGRANRMVWAWGSGTDVPRPPPKKPIPTSYSGRIRPVGLGLQEVQAALAVLGEATCRDLEVRCEMSNPSVNAALLKLKAAGLAYVKEWTRIPPKCAFSRVWTLGRGEDAPRPKPTPRVRETVSKSLGEATPGIPMDFVVKSVFVGGKNPWTGIDVSQMRNKISV